MSPDQASARAKVIAGFSKLCLVPRDTQKDRKVKGWLIALSAAGGGHMLSPTLHVCTESTILGRALNSLSGFDVHHQLKDINMLHL